MAKKLFKELFLENKGIIYLSQFPSNFFLTSHWSKLAHMSILTLIVDERGWEKDILNK